MFAINVSLNSVTTKQYSSLMTYLFFQHIIIQHYHGASSLHTRLLLVWVLYTLWIMHVCVREREMELNHATNFTSLS